MNEGQEQQPVEAGAAGAPEGAAAEPTTNDVQAMYDELGIKSTAPTGKSKGRPKTANVRGKDAAKKDAEDTDNGQGKDTGNKGKSKDAPDSDEDGDAGNAANSKSAKKREDAGKVSDKSEEADGGVRKDKSDGEGTSKRGSEEDAKRGDDGTGEGDDKQKPTQEEGKRPGKSNPEVERRFQQMTADLRERDEMLERYHSEIEQYRQQQVQQKLDTEDPKFTVDDFRKVRDQDGNIIDLDNDQAELAWRRWQDGYNQREAEREARNQQELAQEYQQQQMNERLMQRSVQAYDTLTGIMDSYPELDEESGQFDQEFSDEVMPIIKQAIIYAPGTEPGNQDNNQPVIVGLRIDPGDIIKGMQSVSKRKRNLPLNGLDDNVDTRSSVNVPHSRSSDPTVNAANQLYAELGIDKRM